MKDIAEKAQVLCAALLRSSPPLCEAEAGNLLERSQKILKAVNTLDDVVAVGIVGGTGVGKSTLINALAGEEITPPGSRRPTTDHIVMYRHRATAYATGLSHETLPIKEVLHSSDDLRRVVLMDLPDYDSFRSDHNKVLMEVLPHLDLLLLVTDFYKYGDGFFYELVSRISQAHENRIIIFNKIDLLFEQYGEKGKLVLEDLVEDLKAKLGCVWGKHSPAVLPVSALSAFEAKAKGDRVPSHFLRLENLLGELRESKKRMKIKRCNLDAALEAIRSDLKKLVAANRIDQKLSRFETAIKDCQKELEENADNFITSLFNPELTRAFARYVLFRVSRSWSLPARLVAKSLRFLNEGTFLQASAFEDLAFEDRKKAFLRRQQRVLGRLERTYRQLWHESFPQRDSRAFNFPHLRSQLDNFASSMEAKRFWPSLLAGVFIFAFFLFRPALLEAVKEIKAGYPAGQILSDTLLSTVEGLLFYTAPFFVFLWLMAAAALYAFSVLFCCFRIYAFAEKHLKDLSEKVRRETREEIGRALQIFHNAYEELSNRAEKLSTALENS